MDGIYVQGLSKGTDLGEPGPLGPGFESFETLNVDPHLRRELLKLLLLTTRTAEMRFQKHSNKPTHDAQRASSA